LNTVVIDPEGDGLGDMLDDGVALGDKETLTLGVSDGLGEMPVEGLGLLEIDGDLEDVLSLGNLEAKCQAYGWDVLSMNGHKYDSIRETMQTAKSKLGNGKPIVIIMKTEMGQGVDYMMGTHKWHGSAPNAEQLQSALNQLEETLGDY
jgi:hypothetical protein